MNENESLRELLFSLIEERKSETKRKSVFRYTMLIGFILILILVFFSPIDNDAITKEHTALIEVNGIISPETETNGEKIIPHVLSAMENPLCLGIIIKINSPGGSATQSKLIHDQIIKLRTKHNKPIYSVIEDVGASGGYYIAVSTEKIFSDSTSIVGSIGVRIDKLNFKSLLQKLGIEPITLTAGNDKTILDPFSSLSDKHKKHLNSLLLEIHNQFISDVKESRGKLLVDDNVFSGLFWTGSQAKDLGLIDDLASIYDVNEIFFKNREIVNYNDKKNLFDKFLSYSIGRIIGKESISIKYQ